MKEVNYIRKLSSKLLFCDKNKITKILTKEIEKNKIYKYQVSDDLTEIISIKITTFTNTYMISYSSPLEILYV